MHVLVARRGGIEPWGMLGLRGHAEHLKSRSHGERGNEIDERASALQRGDENVVAFDAHAEQF
jgi:hypothetical protein